MLSVLAAALVLACGGTEPERIPVDPDLDATFDRDALLEDVAAIFRTIEAMHPSPYHRLDPDAATRARTRLEEMLEDGMSRMDFWRLSAPVVALFGDGHTRLPVPREEWGRVWSSGASAFPLVLTFEPERGVVRADLSSAPTLPPGARVLEINGRPLAALVREIKAVLPYEREELSLFALNGSQVSLIWAVHGWEGPFRLLVELPSGERVTRTLPGISSSDWIARADSADLRPSPSPPFSFELLAGGLLGYLDLRSFTDPRGLRPFFKASFRTLKESPPCALVLDVRRNGGGSSDPGDWLLDYLADRPVRQFNRIDVRASAELKRTVRNGIPWPFRFLPARVMGVFDKRAGSLFASPDGALVSWIDPEEVPGRNPLRWEGPVFALVGLQTFSSGADLAAALQDYGIATIVGEETGGLGSAFGDSHVTVLPNTGLRLDVSTKFFVRPSGAVDGRGVVPDVWVPMERGTSSEGDPAIQAVLERVGSDCRPARHGADNPR